MHAAYVRLVCQIYAAVAHNASFTMRAQCYAKVEQIASIAETSFWFLFQTYIFFRQTHVGREVIKGPTLLLSLASSMYNLCTAIDYLKTTAAISHEGNYKSFAKNLLALGAGMAPPMVIAHIRSARDVYICVDLSAVGHRGLMSIAKAISRSRTAETVSFWGTSIKPQKVFIDEFTFNRHRLPCASFAPATSFEWAEVGIAYGLRIQEIRDGPKVVYRREMETVSDMVRLIDQDETYRVGQLLKIAGDIPTDLFIYAASMGRWGILAEMLCSAPANLRDELLWKASGEGQIICMQMLTAYAADPDGNDFAVSSLSYATCCGHEAAVGVLLRAWADVI